MPLTISADESLPIGHAMRAVYRLRCDGDHGFFDQPTFEHRGLDAERAAYARGWRIRRGPTRAYCPECAPSLRADPQGDKDE